MAGPRSRLTLLLAALLLLPACSSTAYFGHLLKGQTDVLRARTPLADIIKDPTQDETLRARLTRVQEARQFAVDHLGLPDSASYRSYVALDRPFVLWNVFAAPEFSLQPREWCYPFYGCFAYRGYYDEARAWEKAASLSGKGLDVHVGGVSAYSTLGWFADPVLSSMMHWGESTLIGTVFHELAHELYYIRDDTAFNESFATFVEEEGLRQWSLSRGENLPEEGALRRQRQADFVQLVEATRERLQVLYMQDMDTQTMRDEKRAVFDQLRAEYRELRDSAWDGWSGYDDWFDKHLNNAKMLPVGLYHQWVPAFEALFVDMGSEWEAFYEAAQRIGELDAEARHERLRELMP